MYHGKAKTIIPHNDPDLLVQRFRDDLTAFNNKKKETIPSKGYICNSISAFLMAELNGLGIKTHFHQKLDDRDQLVTKLRVIPIEVVIRNKAAGSLCVRLGIEERQDVGALVEFYYKNDSLGDPLINDEHALYLKIATSQELEHLKSEAKKINSILQQIFLSKEIILADMKLEFGKDNHGNIILGDEISPDTCRLWDKTTYEKLDKDRFRLGYKEVLVGYKEIAKRLLPEPNN